MELHVASLDELAATMLESGAMWDLVACYERSFFIARRPDGALLSIVRHDLPDGPYTARLDPSAPRDMRVIDETPHVSSAGARTWRPRLIPPAEAVGTPELGRRLAILERIADTAARRGEGAGAVISSAARRRLEDALAADDAVLAVEAAIPIAGLGPGLTPSGDDVLAGALATHAWASAAGLGGDPCVRTAIADAVAARTSRVSRQLLAAAASGHVAAPLAGLLSALLRRAGPFPPDVSAVLALGATSGSDLLVGVRICGRAIVRRNAGGRDVP